MLKFKSHLYFEEKDREKENLEQLKPLPGSKITFFKNGESLGEAFSNIYMVSDKLCKLSTYPKTGSWYQTKNQKFLKFQNLGKII